MNVLEILKKARGIVARPEHWTQNYLARDANGNPVAAESPEACTFCALGAIGHVCKGDQEVVTRARADTLLFDAAEALYGDDVASVNDGGAPELEDATPEGCRLAVLKLYDHAIDAASKL